MHSTTESKWLLDMRWFHKRYWSKKCFIVWIPILQGHKHRSLGTFGYLCRPFSICRLCQPVLNRVIRILSYSICCTLIVCTWRWGVTVKYLPNFESSSVLNEVWIFVFHCCRNCCSRFSLHASPELNFVESST